MNNINIFEKFRSGFRAPQSTETALIKVTRDLWNAAYSGAGSIKSNQILDVTKFPSAQESKSEVLLFGPQSLIYDLKNNLYNPSQFGCEF